MAVEECIGYVVVKFISATKVGNRVVVKGGVVTSPEPPPLSTAALLGQLIK
jgi:hypothetical protein